MYHNLRSIRIKYVALKGLLITYCSTDFCKVTKQALTAKIYMNGKCSETKINLVRKQI